MKTGSVDITEDIFSNEVVVEPRGALMRKVHGEERIISLLKNGNINANERFCLRIESYLLQLAHANNKILSLSNSRTRILAHQVESTHRIVNSLNQRFLIADEVGLGKTIEAGLVIKELIFRYKYKRILIVCPASLLVQWQSEMDEKFGEKFEILDRRFMSKKKRSLGKDENVWESFHRVICSIDFIKSAAFAKDLENTKWDAVIIDEAHRLRRDSQVSTQAYIVGEILSARTKAFLLLTATPFRGKLEELFYLVRLTDKNLLGPFQSFYNDFCMPDSDLSRLKEKLSAAVIRRTKKDIGGFTSRHARTIRFALYDEERSLYEATTRYVAEEFNRALQTQNRAIGFVMVVFQKLLDSSSYALYSALRNRRAHLAEMLEKAEKKVKLAEAAMNEMNELDPDFFDEEDAEDLVTTSAQKTASEMREEIATLDDIIKLALSVKRNKKGEKLREMISHLKAGGKKKFLIFTQFRTTQDYLAGLLSDYKTVVFNGSMDKDQKEDAITSFKNDSEILICTEAGGEGRNMQFCSILFNYDLPWSPLKIEQRIGRIHRFGQEEDVSVYNFSTKDTVAERVLDVLAKKLMLFEESIGTPDIMLGQIEDELKLSSLFMEMGSGKRSKKSVEDEIDRSVERAKASFEKLSELTVAKKMDFNYDEYYRITQKDRAYSNRQLESFITRVRKSSIDAAQYFSEKDSNTGLYPVHSLPDGGRHHAFGTFDSERALASSAIEFLAFGHPLVDHIILHCCSDEFEGHTGATVVDHDKEFEGMVFYYIATYQSVTETKEIVPVVVDLDEKVFSFELDRIERECTRSAGSILKNTDLCSRLSERVAKNADSLKMRAGERVFEKVEQKLWDMREHLDLTIDPEIEKIKESCDRQIRELGAQLERQEVQMKCFAKDMRSAITRTRNKIIEAERERDILLASYRRRMGVSYSIELVSAGILVSGSTAQNI